MLCKAETMKQKVKKEDRDEDKVWTAPSREYACWFSGCRPERGAEPLLSSPPLTAADSMIHQLIYIHATLCEPAQSSLPSCEVQVFILPLHLALFISLFISRLKISLVFCVTLRVLGEHEQLDVFFFFFLYAASSAKVMCCVSEWILPPGCYSHNYLISLKLRAKSWQVVSVLTFLTILGWCGQRLVITLPF